MATLRELAATARERMTPEQRAVYDSILKIRNDFGEPIDVNALLRDTRGEEPMNTERKLAAGYEHNLEAPAK